MHWIDPSSLPETHGTLDRFLVNPDGAVDGFLLRDGTEVHVPPHLHRRILGALDTGSRVRVRGIRPRAADLVAAVSVQPEDGEDIVDDGPDAEEETKPGGSAVSGEASGRVVRQLHGPKGEVRGVMLADGVQLRFPKHAAAAHAGLISPGAELHARGKLRTTPVAAVLLVEELGPSADRLTRIEQKKEKHEKKGKKERGTGKKHAA